MTDAPAISQKAYIEYIPLDDLLAWERNPKDHDLPSIQKSMERFGFTTPVTIDERTKRLAAGHGRCDSLKAMREAGKRPPLRVIIDEQERWCVPVLRGVSFNSDAELEAYLIADNQLTIAGGWDDTKLGVILADLEKMGEGAFDGLGFEQTEIDALLHNLAFRQRQEAARDIARKSLAERFMIPPLSVMDARQGYWQERKRAWIGLGIRSEIGRGENLLKFSKTVLANGGELSTTRQRSMIGKMAPGGSTNAPSSAYQNYGKNKSGKGLGEAYNSGSPETLSKDYKSKGATKSGLTYGTVYAFDENVKSQTGTSIFDPVLTEVLIQWFCPPAGSILDPFAGGSVRGIVAGFLGRAYTGIDLSEAQVAANKVQSQTILQSDSFSDPEDEQEEENE